MLALSPITTTRYYKLILAGVVILTNVLHSFGSGNLASNLLIRESTGIWKMMCFLDVDSHFITEQGGNFFQSSADRLWVDQEDHSDEDGVANDENEEEPPLDMLDGDRRNLYQHDCDGVECAEGHGVAGCSDRRGHDLRRVRVPCIRELY